MGRFGDFFSKVGRGLASVASPLNDLLKSTKVVSTLAGGIPVYGGMISGGAKALGYKKGGRILLVPAPKPMKRGGAVKKAKKPKVGRPKKAKKAKK